MRPTELLLQLTQADTGEDSQLELALVNTLPRALEDWCLHLDLQRDVRAGEGTRLTRVGSHLKVCPAPARSLQPGDTCNLTLRGARRLLQRLSDLPSGCFLSAGDDLFPVRLASHNLEPARESIGNCEVPLANGGAAALLPAPRALQLAGETRAWPNTPRYYTTPEAGHAMEWLQSMLGQSWQRAEQYAGTDLQCIVDAALETEAYRLRISSDAVVLAAATPAGFCRGAATLLQLLEGSAEQHTLPCLTLADEPRYTYRGLMLDCARHFHSVETILDLLDWMALYKLNHFHWHLTDDEAWRLEVPAYPQLTDIGAWRGHCETLPPQLGSGPGRYGGFYSRAEVLRIVEHAACRGITVVPEIDIPGHCRACVHALPELLREPEDTSRYLSVQFFDDNVLNPGLPGTYTFLETVLEEVCRLFPGPYVHLGADEVPEGVWAGSPACRALMQREGYSDPRELQGHLLGHAQRFLAARGRTLVGWEEAAQGDKLTRDAPICAWTGDKAIRELADAGFPVISCPAPRAYLDLAWSDDPGEPGLHWAGTADLRDWYETPPFPTEIDSALGLQANLWSELLSSREQLEYMLFPRVLATAEWGWNSAAGGDWADFRMRVATQLSRLRRRGIAARPLGPDD